MRNFPQSPNYLHTVEDAAEIPSWRIVTEQAIKTWFPVVCKRIDLRVDAKEYP